MIYILEACDWIELVNQGAELVIVCSFVRTVKNTRSVSFQLGGHPADPVSEDSCAANREQRWRHELNFNSEFSISISFITVVSACLTRQCSPPSSHRSYLE